MTGLLNLVFWAKCEKLGCLKEPLWVLPVGGGDAGPHLHPVAIVPRLVEDGDEIVVLGR